MTRARAFTLLEAILVIAVVGVLATVSVTAYGRLKNRTTFSAASNQFQADLSNARAKARGEEQPIVVVLLASTSGGASRYVVLQDNNRTFSLSTYKPGELPAGAKLIADVTWSGAVFESSLTRARPALASPFGAVVTTGGITFGKAGYTAPYEIRGAITFQTDGRAVFSDGSSTGSVYVYDTRDTARDYTLGIIGATGAIKGY